MKNRLQVISPIDQSVFVERELASEERIEKVLSRSKEAHREWRLSSIQERAEICRKAIEYFQTFSYAISEELTWQMGRPILYSPLEITSGFKERAEFMINIAEEALSDLAPSPVEGFHRFIRREPLGSVFVLAPWNYPYLTSVNAIIPALMSGNCVILKHATQTPLCAERYEAAFNKAGLPKGVFQYLHLDHDSVSKVVKDSRINYVAFTGSVKGGAAVQQSLGNRFVASGFELGGKDPAYIRSDANLEHAIENLVDGTFFNSGQSCCGIERIYVAEDRYKDFVDGFVALTNQYNLGNPLDKSTTLGPMVRSSAAMFVQDQVNNAIDGGAKALIDPLDFDNFMPGTPYMAPQVLVNVNHEMSIMKEESFAPLVGIMSVKDDDEAIRLMNDSQYGLTASVWTEDLDKAVEIGNQIETGTFFMNRCDYLDPALAWTGVKNSGRGVALSKLGYEVLTRPKSFHLRTI